MFFSQSHDGACTPELPPPTEGVRTFTVLLEMHGHPCVRARVYFTRCAYMYICLCNVHACACMHVHMRVCVPVLYMSTRVSAYMRVLTCAREHACMHARVSINMAVSRWPCTLRRPMHLATPLAFVRALMASVCPCSRACVRMRVRVCMPRTAYTLHMGDCVLDPMHCTPKL